MKRHDMIVLLVMALCVYSCVQQRVVRDMPPDIAPVRFDSGAELFSDAERMFRFRAYDKALELYNEYLSKFPDEHSAPAALMREGSIYTTRGEHKTARSIYKHLIDSYPDSFLIPDARLELLATFYNEERYHQLIREAESVTRQITSGPHLTRFYVLLGDTYAKASSPVNAVNFYVRAHESAVYTERENILVRLREAIAQLSAEDIRHLLEGMKDDLTRAYLMYRLGVIRYEEGRYEDAVDVLSDFISRFPEHENTQDAQRMISGLDEMPMQSRNKIGCLLPLTGSYKIYGKRALKGIELALAEMKTRAGSYETSPVSIVIKDTGSDEETAIRAVGELAEERVSAIIGPIITAESAAAQAQRKRIPIITLTQKDGITDMGDYVFRHFLTPKMQVETLVAYAMQSLGLRNFAILYPDEKYGTTFMNLFWDEVVSHGGQVVGVETYDPGQTDFGKPIRKLVGRHRRKRGRPVLDFDGIFIPDAPNKAGLIIPQLAYYDVRKVRLFGTNLWHSDKLIRMAGKFARGAVVPDIFFAKSGSAAVEDFVRNFEDTFGDTPGFIEAVAYDTAMMLFQLISRPDIRYRSSLKSDLIRLRNFQGVTGLTSFDNEGEAHKKLYLLRVEKNRFVEVNELLP